MIPSAGRQSRYYPLAFEEALDADGEDELHHMIDADERNDVELRAHTSTGFWCVPVALGRTIKHAAAHEA